ncbi:AMP-binding protein [Marimonas lutisalis]|uniref:AMP-binding protein n=1 Tax=Marimonas lutisalis TaxID=2545756 RepID=UPI0013755B44|nr:AMP-binding protein [Marimonas lutisalis]
MLEIEGKTVDAVFREAVTRWPEADFLGAAAQDGAAARVLTYRQVADLVDKYAGALRAAGYGPGHRLAALMGTCPEHYILKLAANRLGLSFVPVNPDYRPGELAYLLEDSNAALAVASAPHVALMQAGIAEAETTPAFAAFETLLSDLPAAQSPAGGGPVTSESEAGLLYTSGTTGRPKGCILSHEYELMVGQSYVKIGPPIALREASDRVFNPLPAFHINAGVVSFFGVMQTGNCLIQPQRFSASSWWRDIAEARATIFHYLGVVIAVLLADKRIGPEVLGHLRAGIGAGVEPALHVEFERRFGIPLIEVWGMTEMCRVYALAEEPRLIHTRAFGRARDDLDVQVWDDAGQPCPPETPGEMVLRHPGPDPQKGFFSGYLNKPEATKEAWAGGWFHTGDTVTMDADGVLFFVDRKKNIIRRAGENIAAAEVENVLSEDERVVNVACVAAPDDVREEEVLACIVLAEGVEASRETGLKIFQQAFDKLAYYKTPGWILFVDELPVTGTQKVVKHKIFEPGEDPRTRPGILDFRDLKKKG